MCKLWSFGWFDKILKGVKISGFCVIGIENNTAMLHSAIQTPSVPRLRGKGMILLDYHAYIVIESKDMLSSLSLYLTVYGIFHN